MRIPVLVATTLVLATAACTQDATNPFEPTPSSSDAVVTSPTAAAFALKSDTGTHAVGEVIHFTLVGRDGAAAPAPANVRWASSDSTVVAFAEPGSAIARSAGSAMITATGSFGVDSMWVIIRPWLRFHLPVGIVALEPEELTLAPGDTARLIPRFLTRFGFPIRNCDMTWTISDSSVAKVGSLGLVTALAVGTATVAVQCQGRADSSRLEVRADGTQSPPTPAGPQHPQTPDKPAGPSGGRTTSGGALIADAFTDYASDGDLRGAFGAGRRYSDLKSPELLHLDREVRYRGHPTMRYEQPASSSATPQVRVRLPRSVTDLWYRAKMRFSPGWSTKGSLPPARTAEAYKIFGIGWAGDYDGRFTLDYTNTSEYEISLNMKARNSGKHPILVYGHAGRVGSEWTDGQWYDVIVHVWQPTSTSYKAQFWLSPDGQTPVLRATITGTMNSGRAPAMSRVMLGMNFNDTRYPDQNQSLWYGEWQVIDGSKHPNPFGL